MRCLAVIAAVLRARCQVVPQKRRVRHFFRVLREPGRLACVYLLLSSAIPHPSPRNR